MAARKWTDEQSRVINSRNTNLLVSAAAGSGKTAVLVERIIRKITDTEQPVDIDSMLVMTFTNAAASEMKERVSLAVEDLIMTNSDNDHLIKQQALMHTAQITTIHSFCLSIIREYFHVLDLDPAFRIGEEAEIALLQTDTIAELLERRYDEADGGFLELVECYGDSKSDAKLEELVMELYRYAISYPWPEEWFNKVLSNFEIESPEALKKKDWLAAAVNYIRLQIKDALEHSCQAITMCSMPGGPEHYLDLLVSESDYLSELWNAIDYDSLAELLHTPAFGRLPGKKAALVDEELKEKVKAEREMYKDIVTNLKKDFFFQDIEGMYEDICCAKSSVSELIKLTMEFIDLFSEKKRERNIIDFNDIEHFALKILVEKNGEDIKETPQALEVRSRFNEIMIDEYQDSNLIQECIAVAVAGDETIHPYLFMVGDVKQSIYKFRMARPELFLDKYRRYSKAGEAGRCINLTKNFRSRREVLDSCNEVFRLSMIESTGGTGYREEEWLNTGAEYEEPTDSGYRTEILLCDGNISDEISEESEQEENERVIEALAAVRRIKELVNDKKMFIKAGDGRYRNIILSDIVILLRTMNGWADVYAEVLNSEGIPVYADVQTGFFRTMEIRTILDYLRILDNPRQDIPLAAVLHSIIGGFDSGSMAEIRLSAPPSASFYDALTTFAELEESELSYRVRDFLRVYRYISGSLYGHSIANVINTVYEYTGLYNLVSAMPNGAQRRSNLDMLLINASAFENSSYTGLFSFIRYIERLISYNIDYGEVSTGETDNAVRIMSIHKSKGLEFPIVILGGLNKQFNISDSYAGMVMHADYGIGPDYIDTRLRTRVPTLIKKVIGKLIKNDCLAEELRILYVAMTRAREKLILLGTDRKPEKNRIKWESAAGTAEKNGCLSFTYLTGAAGFADFVLPAALLNPMDFEIKTVKTSELKHSKKEEEKRNLQKKEEYLCIIEQTDEPLISDKELIRVRDYKYPYSIENELPVKLSVSELKHMSIEEEFGSNIFKNDVKKTGERMPVIPEFMSERREVSGTDRGTLYHKIMQFIKLPIYSGKELDTFFEAMVIQGRLDKQELSLINANKILAFTSDDIAGRMAAAEERGLLFREQPFIINIPVKSIVREYKQFDTAESSEGIMIPVQGIIDVFFEEKDGVVILDYKTDKLPENGEEILIRRYRTQLDYYAEAVSTILNKTVKEKILYSFSLSKVIRVD